MAYGVVGADGAGTVAGRAGAGGYQPARLGGRRVALLQGRDDLAGEEGGLVAGEGLDQQTAGAGLVDHLLQGVDDLGGGTGDGDDRPALGR